MQTDENSIIYYSSLYTYHSSSCAFICNKTQHLHYDVNGCLID